MKKTILIALVLAVMAGLFATGAAAAQGSQPPAKGGGLLHPYFAAALAEKLGLSVDEVNARLAAGETMYQIALAEGIPATDIPALLAEIRTTAIEKAAADGVISRAMADRMIQRLQQRRQAGFGTGTGTGTGTCTGTCPMDGSGAARRGPGTTPGTGMMGGWRFQQTNP